MGGPLSGERLVVVGGGTMGQGIAQVGVESGLGVCVVDVTPERGQAACDAIGRRWARAVAKGTLTRDAAAGYLRRLTAATDLTAVCAGAAYVVEAVAEDLRVKVDVLTSVVRSCPPEALVATNTSALSVTEMAAATGSPGRLIGLHFFNPVPRMALVEVVRGLETAEDAVRRGRELAVALGKQPVVVRDSPGFVASRINALIGNEAFYILQEGTASAEDIDTALRLGLNHPMGPFELGDLVGWDVRVNVLRYLGSVLGEKYRPCPLMLEYVAAGRLGRKAGRGVFDYPAS
jgi:3-hydroxybutyryl-CoA dehydrogenase